jgi:dTDP-4-dehydrorhamnose 3,5-epimerase-like enzyme
LGAQTFQIIDLKKHADDRGWLGVVQNDLIPFKIQRIFFIRDIPPGMTRGGHAHLTCHELIICLDGGFQASVDDGSAVHNMRFHLPDKALYLPPMHWVTLNDFEPGSIVMVMASHLYNPADKLDDYNEFKKAKSALPQNLTDPRPGDLPHETK